MISVISKNSCDLHVFKYDIFQGFCFFVASRWYTSILGRINMWHFVEDKKPSSEPNEPLPSIPSQFTNVDRFWGWISCQPGPFFLWRRTWSATSGSGRIASMRRGAFFRGTCFSDIFRHVKFLMFFCSPFRDCHFVAGSVRRWTVVIGRMRHVLKLRNRALQLEVSKRILNPQVFFFLRSHLMH